MVEHDGQKRVRRKSAQQALYTGCVFARPGLPNEMRKESELELVADTEHMEVGIAVVLVLTVLV